ncbi:conjugal transfer protein TraN [Asticcacaulis sp. W401b]|uniref:conjugal transfer protein TraN n=1 Tax=Asticcacaulis sp. W401b TaxID=3388666 RepID=UPI0039709BF9
MSRLISFVVALSLSLPLSFAVAQAPKREDFGAALNASNAATNTSNLYETLPGYQGDAPDVQARSDDAPSDLNANGMVASTTNSLTPVIQSNQSFLGANRIDENATWVKNALAINGDPQATADGATGGGSNACHLQTASTTETTLYTCESGNVIGEGDFSCSLTRGFRKKDPVTRSCVTSRYTGVYGTVPPEYRYIHHCQRAIMHHGLPDASNGCGYLTGSGACLALYGLGPDWATVCNRVITGRSKVTYEGMYEETCADTAACTQQTSVCRSYFGVGFCEREEKDFLCDAGGYEDLGVSDSGCNALLANPTCTQRGSSCAQTANMFPEIMAHFGFAADYCLSTAHTYRCQNITGTGSNCEPDASCSFKTRTCIDETAAGDAGCQSWENVYECKKAVTTPVDASVCDASWVMGTTTIEAVDNPDQDIASAVSALNAAKGASNTFEAEMSIFKGQDLRCGKAVLGFANCCKDSGWGTDVGLAECNSNELKLMESQKKKACHYVGTYCSKDSLFGCLQKSMTYCCYGNSLARIIQEAGHQQLGIGWGSAKSPNCAGFSVEDFQKLDLTSVDFSDFYNEKLGQLAETDQGSTVAAITSSIEAMNGSGTPKK